MYQFLKEQIAEQFRPYRTIRETASHSVSVIRHKLTGILFVLREFDGHADCYQKLLKVSSPYLPGIYEVAEDRPKAADKLGAEDTSEAADNLGAVDTSEAADNLETTKYLSGRVLVLEEYVEGDSLHEMLADACFSEQETIRIAMDVCRALYVLHGLDIIHRDVKPENIILRGSQAVLLDFDAARIYKPGQTADTTALGTVGYAPPEQFGVSETDVRSDIYALGVTMNIMLTGTHPSVRLAGGRLGRIIKKCTMTQPAGRYRDVLHLMQALAV